MQVDMACLDQHKRGMCSILKKPFLSSYHTSICAYNSVQLLFYFKDLMVSFSHLYYNVIQLGCGAISDRDYKIVQNLP